MKSQCSYCISHQSFPIYCTPITDLCLICWQYKIFAFFNAFLFRHCAYPDTRSLQFNNLSQSLVRVLRWRCSENYENLYFCESVKTDHLNELIQNTYSTIIHITTHQSRFTSLLLCIVILVIFTSVFYSDFYCFTFYITLSYNVFVEMIVYLKKISLLSDFF